MTPQEALQFVEQHGVVLESASGKIASVAEAVAGATIRGSWWAHPRSHEIFAVTRAVRDSPDVLVCRLVGGKVTFVHRRLWPSLVRVADRFPLERLSRIREVHAESGRHVVDEDPFPDWVPRDIKEEARQTSETAALRVLRMITE